MPEEEVRQQKYFLIFKIILTSEGKHGVKESNLLLHFQREMTLALQSPMAKHVLMVFLNSREEFVALFTGGNE